MKSILSPRGLWIPALLALSACAGQPIKDMVSTDLGGELAEEGRYRSKGPLAGFTFYESVNGTKGEGNWTFNCVAISQRLSDDEIEVGVSLKMKEMANKVVMAIYRVPRVPGDTNHGNRIFEDQEPLLVRSWKPTAGEKSFVVRLPYTAEALGDTVFHARILVISPRGFGVSTSLDLNKTPI